MSENKVKSADYEQDLMAMSPLAERARDLAEIVISGRIEDFETLCAEVNRAKDEYLALVEILARFVAEASDPPGFGFECLAITEEDVSEHLAGKGIDLSRFEGR